MTQRISLYFIFIIFSNVLSAQFRCQEFKAKHDASLSPPSLNYNARSDTFNIHHIDLELDFSALPTRFLKAVASLDISAIQANNGTLTLDLLELTVDSVRYNGQSASYNYNDTLLKIQLPTQSAHRFAVDVYYQGAPPGDASGWGGWHQSNGYYFNLGVGFAADPHPYGRAWHPCFDNFVEKATYSFAITTRAPLRAYANGLRTAEQALGGDTTLVQWNMTDSIPSYLASVAISNYAEINDTFNLALGNVPVQLMAKPADSLAMLTSYSNLLPITQSFENAFGPYRWQKVGYASTTTGAMEHATSIHMPERLIRNNSGEDIVAHELAHHWWGNLVTCQTDADMWINEGMSEYSSHFYEESVYGKPKYWSTVRANQLYVLERAHIRDNGYKAIQGLDHAYVYGAHVYQKGAMVGHNLRVQLGDSLFFSGLTQLLNQNAFGNLTSIQFRDQLSALTGENLNDFFTDQVLNPGFASYRVDSLHVQSNSTGQRQVTVTIGQARHQAPRLFKNVVLHLELVDANDQHYKRKVKHSGRAQTYNFTIPSDLQHVLINYDGGQLTADTYDEFSFLKNGLQSGPNTSLAVNLQSPADSNLRMIATQHWAGPGEVKGIPGKVSNRRFWSLVDEGGDISSANFDLRINLDGAPLGSEGDLLAQTGDSLRVFYRENPSGNWKLYANADINVFGSNGNRQGWVDLNDFSFNGMIDLVLANVAIDFSTEELSTTPKPFRVFPNPAADSITISLTDAPDSDMVVEIFSINGKLLSSHTIRAHETSLKLDLENSEEKVIIKANDYSELVIISR